MMKPEVSAFYKVESVTIKQRFLRWLFPARVCELPVATNLYQDVIYHNVVVHLSFWDRIRLLLCGKIAVRSKIACQFMVGETRSNSEAYPTYLDN